MKKTMLAALGALFLLMQLGAQVVQRISPADARALLEARDAASRPVLLDVRTKAEYEEGHIKGARLLPYDSIDAASAARAIPSKTTPVIVYCRSGRRSAVASETLKRLGFTRILDLGGVQSWPYGLVRD